MNVLLLISFLIGQAPLPPQAPPIPKEVVKVKEPTYSEMRDKAIKESKPLLVYVDMKAPFQMEGCLVIEVKDFMYASPKTIVIGLPKNGELYRMDIPGEVSALGIRRSLETLRLSLEPRTSVLRSFITRSC